jgi:two-component system response regulator HydG
MNKKNARVLVVDDEADLLFAVKMLLKSEVQEVVTEKNPENLISLLSKQSFDVIFLDMNFKSALNTGNEGFFWLSRILEKDPQANVVMITAYGDVEQAVRALKVGASDFILKPWRNEKLIEALEQALSRKSQKVKGSTAEAETSASVLNDFHMLGQSEAMQEVFKKIEKIAPTEANVLILGENGTGKELVARALHQKSFRAAKPFVLVDMAALSENLMESELFGHRKGAFTDAKQDRPGRFEAANGGTLFLDEIGNIPLPMQTKLLTALQNRQVVPLGSNQPEPVDIRLISATNASLYEMAASGAFRKDLIYRINTVEILLPPLRQRGEDIVLLARHFAAHYARKNHRPIPEFEAATLRKLREYHWPGNIRELQHSLERAIILSEGDVLRPQDFSFSSFETTAANTTGNTPQLFAQDSSLPLSELERNAIIQVIEKNKGNISRAAKELGITRSALYRRLDKHDI